MFLGAYRFAGNTNELMAAYEQMINAIPASALHLHVCVRADEGLVIFDTCPSREAFEKFSGGESFRAVLEAAGLPVPEIQLLGDVHSAFFGGQRLA